jgi:acetyl esterase
VRASGAAPFHRISPAEGRSRAAALREGMERGPEMATVESVTISGRNGQIPARIYGPSSGPSPGVVVYFHGGGWVLGGLDESDALCRTLARTSGCDVVSVDYRLAPEHRFPAAIDDAFDAAVWVAETRFPGARLVVMGDSAGGNLAAVVARRSRDRGGPAIVLQVLVYPVADHRMQSPSFDEHGQQYLISAADLHWFWDQYIPDARDRAGEDASPLLTEDLSRLCPALIVVAEFDPLRDESLNYARRLAAAGVPVTVERYESMAHGFFALVGLLDTASAAVESVGRVIADVVRAD